MPEDEQQGSPGDRPVGGLPDSVADPELIARVRGGDVAAYEELFLRHRPVAVRYARRLAGAERGEDLVAEAFTKILDLLRRGKGPDVAFRAYLLTTVRTSHLNTLRAGRREDLVPEHEASTEALTVEDDPDSRFDRSTVLHAFTQLPARWQSVLWLTSVEGLSNEEVAERLDIKVNAVASLAFRARAGLRQAFLAQHLQRSTSPECRHVLDLLPAQRRGTLGPRGTRVVERHLPTCPTCTAAALELSEVDARLGALVGPVGLTVLTAGVGASAGAGNVGAMLATLKSALVLLGTQVKGWAAGAPWVLGAKVALVAIIAATGVAVGAHALDDRPKQKDDETAVSGPGAPQPTSAVGVDDLPTTDPSDVPTLVPGSTATDGATVLVLPPGATATDGATGTPTTSPTTSPTSSGSPTKPSPSDSPTASEEPQARSMAVSQVRAQKRSGGIAWNRVTVQLSDVVQGTTMHLTATRTNKASIVGGSGWSCSSPKITWVDGQPWASSSTTCTYTAASGSGPFVIDYQVANNARASVSITPPAGYDDASTSDNSGSAAMNP